MNTPPQRKAFVLFSGGLDSQLAVKVLQEQGIHVEAIAYRSPFFATEKSEIAAQALDVVLHIIDFTEEILAAVVDPAHGHGKAMNPCIDCHARMARRAGQEMEKHGFDFIATGEVLGQRPMSQNRRSLAHVAQRSGYGDVLLRPLSAALLDPIKPVREGWVDVEHLPKFSGRNRTPQVQLAEHFKIKDYPAPAGGCLLTEPLYGKKLKDLIDHEGFDAKRTNVWLLQTGRHLRLSNDVKIIVGSDQATNQTLALRSPPSFLRITCPDRPSPTTIAPPHIGKEHLQLAAAICAGYAKAPIDQPAQVQIKQDDTLRTIEVLPIAPTEARQYFIC